MLSACWLRIFYFYPPFFFDAQQSLELKIILKKVWREQELNPGPHDRGPEPSLLTTGPHPLVDRSSKS